MKNIIYILTIVSLIVSCKPKEPAKLEEEVNYKAKMSEQLEGATLWYQKAAEMKLSYLQSYAYGKQLLDKNLTNKQGEKPAAVVLDLDETVLNNSPYEGMLIKNQQVYTDETWDDWVKLAQADILPGAEDFIRYAQNKGVEVFYISNRPHDLLGYTLQNLQTLELPNADSTHILLKKDTSDKTKRRSQVSESYEILVFVGDNLTDYSELYADRNEAMAKDLVEQHQDELLNRFVMLPNPMYGEWEKAVINNDWSQSDSARYQLRLNAIESY